MQIEWRYEDAIYDVDVVLARLLVRDDGTAQIVTDDGETLEFGNRDEASYWLTDEEYDRLDTPYEVLTEQGTAIDARIEPSCATCGGDLLERMVFKLG